MPAGSLGTSENTREETELEWAGQGRFSGGVCAPPLRMSSNKAHTELRMRKLDGWRIRGRRPRQRGLELGGATDGSTSLVCLVWVVGHVPHGETGARINTGRGVPYGVCVLSWVPWVAPEEERCMIIFPYGMTWAEWKEGWGAEGREQLGCFFFFPIWARNSEDMK